MGSRPANSLPHLGIVASDGSTDDFASEYRRIWIASACCLLGSLVLGALSTGCYHDDDLTHYLMARWAGWFPGYLLHIWGRPGLTVPLAAVSWFGDRFTGWHAARAMSSLATAAGAIIAARLALRLGVRRAGWVVLACYAQPLAAILSYTTLTENWTALYLVAAVALLHRRYLMAASGVFSLALVTRHEAVIFIPIWWLALWLQPSRRRSIAAVVSLWAPVLHNILFWIVFDEWPVRIYFQPRGSTEFVATGPLAYVPHVMYAVPPVLLALAFMTPRVWLRRDRWLVFALPAVFLVLHAAIKSLGLFASGGYGRFMVAMAPFIAILAVHQWEQLSGRSHLRRFWISLLIVFSIGWIAVEWEHAADRLPLGSPDRMGWIRFLGAGLLAWAFLGFAAVKTQSRPDRAPAVAMCALLLGLLLAQWALLVRPLRMKEDERKCEALAAWLREQHLDQRPLFVTHPWLVFELGLIENPRAHKGPRLLASMPKGSLVIYDSRYMSSDFHAIPPSLLTAGPYQPLSPGWSGASSPGLKLEIVEKLGETPWPETGEVSYPLDLPALRRPVTGIYYLREAAH